MGCVVAAASATVLTDPQHLPQFLASCCLTCPAHVAAHEHANSHLTTRQVVKRYLLPRYPMLAARYCDTLPDALVGRPQFLVSHRYVGYRMVHWWLLCRKHNVPSDYLYGSGYVAHVCPAPCLSTAQAQHTPCRWYSCCPVLILCPLPRTYPDAAGGMLSLQTWSCSWHTTFRVRTQRLSCCTSTSSQTGRGTTR